MVKIGMLVEMHAMSGSWPAMVNKVNPDGTLNLTIFTSGDIVHRDSVSEYLPDPDDDEDAKVGMWTRTI